MELKARDPHQELSGGFSNATFLMGGFKTLRLHLGMTHPYGLFNVSSIVSMRARFGSPRR